MCSKVNDRINKITLSFKTLSYVISSPRESQAFYKGVDFEEKDIKLSSIDGINKINIIYPFHQYGQYKKYDDSNKQYYIPASTIKGAIFNNDIKNMLGYSNKTIMVDDAIINNRDNITLKQLMKIQYLPKLDSNCAEHRCENNPVISQETGLKLRQLSPVDDISSLSSNKTTKYDIFFQNVAVQMLKPNSHFTCDVYYSSDIDFNKILGKAFEIHKKNIVRYIKRIDQYDSIDIEIKNMLKMIKKDLNNIKNTKKILCIGGYKGLIMSLVSDKKLNANEMLLKQNSSFFLQTVDNESKSAFLPYGLVEVEIIDSKDNYFPT